MLRLAILATAVLVSTTGLATAAGKDLRGPRLRPVAADIERARSLVLTNTDLPPGFHLYREHGDPLTRFTGTCGRLAAPDLSALTETANVTGRVVANTYSGAQYLPTAYVFASAKQAARAQTLQTGLDKARCGSWIIKNALKQYTVPTTATGETHHRVAYTDDGVIVRGLQVMADVKVSPNSSFRAEVSFLFLRHGRALSEIRTQSAWNAATRRTWNDAVDATARRLKRSGF